MRDALTNTVDFLPDPSAQQIMDNIAKFRDEANRAMYLPPHMLNFRMERCTPELRIIEDSSLVVTTEDWSGVRSPGRARRRRRKYPQNIKITSRPSTDSYIVGDKLICHPATADSLRKHAADEFQRTIDKMFRRALMGGA